jgi:hypothetical protein
MDIESLATIPPSVSTAVRDTEEGISLNLLALLVDTNSTR